MLNDLYEIEAELCRRSFFYFVQYFWDTVIAEKPVWNWHIPYLCDEMQHVAERVFLQSRGVDKKTGLPLEPTRLEKEFDYIIINVPPGSSKSTIASEMYPIWCWTRDATQRFICGSYSSTIAEDIGEKSKKIFDSDKFKKLFPHLHNKGTKGGKSHFHNGLLGERMCTSTDSTITGIHAHQKIVDDPMNPKIAASKLERENANKWLSGTLSSRDVDESITVTFLIMQRLHELDSTGYILKKQKEGLRVKHICLPLELDDKNQADVKPQSLKKFYKDGLFDPIRRPRKSIPKLKLDLGTYGYAGQMQQRPAPAEGGIIKKEWFGYIDRTGPKATSRTINFQMDSAYTEETKNDPTGVVAYYKEHEHIYIVNRAVVYKEFPDLIVWFKTWVKENGYDGRSMIRVEPKASGKSIVQSLKRVTKLNIKEDESPKDDKLTRLTIASPKIEAGRVILHRGGWNEDFVEEICGFPNAEHDEMVDCISAIVKNELIGDDDLVDNSEIAGAFG